MATMISEEHAKELLKILDTNIGFFNIDVNEREASLKFKENKTEEFLKTYSTEIPDSYWFQGQLGSSLSLIFDSTEGFHVVSNGKNNHQENEAIEKTNTLIKESDFNDLINFKKD